MVNYDLIEKKKWSEFIENIRYGEVAQFTASSPQEIDTIRTVASRINASGKYDFVYSVEGNNDSCRMQIFTKPRL